MRRGSREFIAHWDDDDWMAGSRLSQQIEALMSADADVVGLDQLLFWDINSDRAFRYSYPSYEPAWVHDPTFCYRRTMWLRDPFPNANFGLDSAYLSAGTPKRVVPISDATFYVGIIHGGNTSPKRTSMSRWRSCPTEEVELRLGDDRTFYERVRS